MEKFFLIGCQVNEIELKELLLRKYGRYDFPDMSFGEFIDFVVLAINKENEDKIYGQYLAMLPFLMIRGKYIPFEQFYEKMTGADLDMRPAEDILKESEEIERKLSEIENNGS